MPDVMKWVDELASILDEHGLIAIRYKDGDLAVEVRRDAPNPHGVSGEAGTAIAESGISVPSPMVGVFFRRRSPGEPAVVEEGERISVGQVIGVIEAMKVFSEVESPVAGTVKRFVVEDGALVQEGDPLLIVEP